MNHGRPSRDQVLADMATMIAQRSTCDRMHVGVIIAREGRPLVSGYNGAPAGMPHCKHDCICSPRYMISGGDIEEITHTSICPADKPCKITIHAEANAIAYAARWGVGIEGAELFTTLSPCRSCAQLIIASGITRVISLREYRDLEGLELLTDAGVILT